MQVRAPTTPLSTPRRIPESLMALKRDCNSRKYNIGTLATPSQTEKKSLMRSLSSTEVQPQHDLPAFCTPARSSVARSLTDHQRKGLRASGIATMPANLDSSNEEGDSSSYGRNSLRRPRSSSMGMGTTETGSGRDVASRLSGSNSSHEQPSSKKLETDDMMARIQSRRRTSVDHRTPHHPTTSAARPNRTLRKRISVGTADDADALKTNWDDVSIDDTSSKCNNMPPARKSSAGGRPNISPKRISRRDIGRASTKSKSSDFSHFCTPQRVSAKLQMSQATDLSSISLSLDDNSIDYKDKGTPRRSKSGEEVPLSGSSTHSRKQKRPPKRSHTFDSTSAVLTAIALPAKPTKARPERQTSLGGAKAEDGMDSIVETKHRSKSNERKNSTPDHEKRPSTPSADAVPVAVEVKVAPHSPKPGDIIAVSTAAEDDDTPTRTTYRREPKQTWDCICGYQSDKRKRFCGMCGTKKHWVCGECQADDNLCIYKFCAMCGIQRTEAKTEDVPISPSPVMDATSGKADDSTSN